MQLFVIGLGFVGLTTALGFAEKGHAVFGYDTDTKKTSELQNKQISLYEPELGDALSRHLGGNFTLCQNYLVTSPV